MKMLIGGKAVDASDGKTIDVINPANGKLVDTIPSATPEDVAKAVSCAKEAQKKCPIKVIQTEMGIQVLLCGATE